MTTSCLQQEGKERVILKSKYKKSNHKVSSKRCGWEDSSDDAPPCRKMNKEQGNPQSPTLGLAGSCLTRSFGGCQWLGRSHPSRRAGSGVWVVSPVPEHHRLILKAMGSLGYALSESTRSRNFTSKSFFYHCGSYRAPAVSVAAHTKQ